MPERRRRWLRQTMQESGNEVSKEEEASGAKRKRCGVKWFSMSNEERKAFREKMREHKRERGSHAQQGDVSSLRKSMEDMTVTSPPEAAQPPQQAMGRPMTFGPWLQHGMHPPPHPMMMAQHPMAMMWMNPCHARKWWKRCMMRAAMARPAQNASKDAGMTSASDSDDVTAAKEAADEGEMPECARQWFELPMQVRFRLWKLFKQSGGRLPDGVPAFVVEWFALDEKKRKEMRQRHRASWRSQKQCHGRRGCAKSTVVSEVEKQTHEQVPDFVREWLELPRERKHELRKLHADVTSSNSEASSSDDVAQSKQTLPEFARAWFALSEEERSRLRCIYMRRHQGSRHAGHHRHFGHPHFHHGHDQRDMRRMMRMWFPLEHRHSAWM